MNNLLKRTIDLVSDAVVVTDRSFKIKECNRVFVDIFCEGADPRGKFFLEAVRIASLFEILNKALASLEFSSEFDLSGRSFLAAAHFFTEEEKIVCIIRDETAIKRLEKVRSDFISNITHQMKTPLTSIVGYSETLVSSDKIDPATMREFSQVIYDNANRLKTLIDEILTLSKAESGVLEVKMKEVDLFDLVRGVVGQFSSGRFDRKIELAGENISVTTDPWLLENIVSNLLDNAIKYSPNGSKVSVDIATSDGKVTIAIGDEGCGIPEDKIPRVFERFYRVEETSNKCHGFGLGLSIARHLAERIGAEIIVSSSLQKGSIFSIVLPA